MDEHRDSACEEKDAESLGDGNSKESSEDSVQAESVESSHPSALNGNADDNAQSSNSNESSEDAAGPASAEAATEKSESLEKPPDAQKVQDPDEKKFEENVKYLYRSHQREPGKRKVKPNLQLLEMDLNLPEEDSEDDSDYKVEGEDDQGEDDEEDDDDEELTDEDDDDDDENSSSTKKKDNGELNGVLSAIEKAQQLSNGIAMNGLFKTKVCNICLGDTSVDNDEIVECDFCGVTVHEGCYGVSDNDSTLSTGSSSTTEPWFCDSCKAGVDKPRCELCPSLGGIFKETDAGRWVHLVCALYTPGCAFGSTEKLTPVTLFEMPYSNWGLKPCHLCDDPMMARTGVTINCDAGMCRIFFHVTCAQRMGLLSDAAAEVCIADPFYGHCKVHVDKMRMKTKKRNWAILQHQVKLRREKDKLDEFTEPTKERERALRKLHWLRDRYATKKANNSYVWLPTQKMPRYMPSSSTAIEKFRRKADLYGLSHIMIAPSDDGQWHTQVSFTIDFVAYFLDRQRQMKELEDNLEKIVEENASLRKEQENMHELFEKVSSTCSSERKLNCQMSDLLSKLWAPLREAGVTHEPKILQNKLEDLNSPQKMLKTCKVCSSVENQHQQIECEQCHGWFHLFCLNPPLARFPKKTKGTNWLCEDCLEANRQAHELNSSQSLTSSRRSRQQASRIIRASSEESASRTPRNRSAAKRKVARKAKPKAKETKESKASQPSPNKNQAAKEKKETKDDSKEGSDPETEDDAAPTQPPKTADEPPSATPEKPVAKSRTPAPKRARKRKPASRSGGSSKRRRPNNNNNSNTSATTNNNNNPTTNTTTTTDSTPDNNNSNNNNNTNNINAIESNEDGETITDDPTEPMQTNGEEAHTSGDEAPKDVAKDTKKDEKKIDSPPTDQTPPKKTCKKCENSEGNQIVVCDECGTAFHWGCLEPPAKKNPKPRGYTWACEDCESKNSKMEEELDANPEEIPEEKTTEPIPETKIE